MPTRIHDEIIEEFVPTCRHCKKTATQHAQDKCLFESTPWDPMTPTEWTLWRREVWSQLADPGTNYLREQLRNEGFAKKVLSQYSWGSSGG
jgi:hypothetical protein